MELKVEIPNELETEFRVLSKVELSILVSKVMKDKLSRLVRLKEIVSKSKLTEEQARELAGNISESLAKRYDKLLPENVM